MLVYDPCGGQLGDLGVAAKYECLGRLKKALSVKAGNYWSSVDVKDLGERFFNANEFGLQDEWGALERYDAILLLLTLNFKVNQN